MGGSSSKSEENQTTTKVTNKNRNKGTKQVVLLVLHGIDQQARSEANDLQDTLQDHLAQGSIKVVDKKIYQIPNNGQFPEDIRDWIQTQLNRGRHVVIYLLSPCDVGQLQIGNNITVFNKGDSIDDLVPSIMAGGH